MLALLLKGSELVRRFCAQKTLGFPKVPLESNTLLGMSG